MGIDQTVVASLGLTESALLKGMISDVQEVFSTMVGKDNLLHLPLMLDPITHFEGCVTAMVGMAGTYNGVISLHAPQKLALDFASGMLGMELTEMDADVHDALGEIANMIAGSFKQYLSQGGTDVRLSTPSIIAGNDYRVSVGCADDTLVLCFAADEQCFLVNAFVKGNS
jgi:chemotaxis protein CheX